MKKDNYFENANNIEHRLNTKEEEVKDRKSNAANKIPVSQSPAKPPIVGHEML